MFLHEIQKNDKRKVFEAILRSLQGLGITLTESMLYEMDSACLLESCVEYKARIIKNGKYNKEFDNPRFIKVFLLEKALRIFLREIAPKRRRIEKRKKKRDGIRYGK